VKKGYWVVAYRSIADEAVLKEYGKLSLAAIAAHGGRPLIRTSDIAEAPESGLKQRTTVIEFESLAKAREAYASEAYRKALNKLGSAAERDFRIVEGVEREV
jgi:uncharacterized protein (DUF1330 family)